MSATTSAPAEVAGLALVSALQRAVTGRRSAAEQHVGNVKTAIDAVFALGGGASIKGDQDERQLLFNEAPLRSQARAIEGLLSHFGAAGISEVRFTRALSEPEVTKLLTILRKPADVQDPFAACRKILEGLWSTGLRGTVDIISLEQLGHRFARTVKVDDPTRARLTYGRVLAVLSDYLANEKSDELQRYFGWKLMKAVDALVGLALENERHVLALATVRGADNYVVNHATNTAALAILVGKRLGLPRSLLVQLGYAALFHSSGKLRTPPAIVNKGASGRLPQEAREYARHPYRGVGVLLDQRRLEDPIVTCALVAFQYDARKGLPVTRAPLTEIHPLAQIVAVCEAFDARVATGKAPFEALAAATEDPTRPFDPVLVHVLGSLVAKMPG